VGLTLDDDQGVMWRSVLESIGYDYMEITDIYRSAGVNLDRITVTEGGSRDSLWNQIKSDMLSSEVVRYKNKGGAVVTNCLFAAYAAGDITEIRENLAKILVVDEEYKPDAKNTALYRTISEFRRDLITKDMPHAFARLWEIKKQV
jgi:xylulokinase